MKKIVLLCTISILAIMACTNETGQKIPVRVELLSSSWLFNLSQPVRSTLTAQTQQTELEAPEDIEKGFTLVFKVDLKTFNGEETILEIPQVLHVRLRQHDVQDLSRQNYPAFKMPDGSVPVLEASLTLQLPTEKREVEDMIVGIPWACLNNQ